MESDANSLGELERENQRLRLLLAELDEVPMPKEAGRLSALKGVSDLNTGLSKRIRSTPEREDNCYLDLYVLQREWQRLAGETVALKKRRLLIGRRMADIAKEMSRKEEKALGHLTLPSSAPAAPSREPPATGGRAQWNTLKVEY